MTRVIDKRLTAEMDGAFVVFLIGMRFNKLWKPWKWFPVFTSMAKLLRELANKPESGFLGADLYFGSVRRPMLVQYWRSFEHLHTYARSHDEPHWPVWVNFNKRIGSNGDVGIWHETYLVPAGSYECVYNNMPAIGLGAATNLTPAVGRKATAARRAGIRNEAYPKDALTDGIQV